LFELKHHKENGWQGVSRRRLAEIAAEAIPDELKAMPKRPTCKEPEGDEAEEESEKVEVQKPRNRTSRRRREAALPWCLEGGEWLQSGPEWQQTLALMEDAIRQLGPAITSGVLLRNSPNAVYKAVLEASAFRPGEKPLPQSDSETRQDHALRAETQQLSMSYILARSSDEREQDFKLRVGVFKAAAQASRNRKKKTIPLVLPVQPSEKPSDFEQRMNIQAHTSLMILPRGAGEHKADFERRLESIKECSARWATLNMMPPLVLPRGRNESESAFTRRLDQACEPPGASDDVSSSCLVILPQAHGEDDEQFFERLRCQEAVDETILAFNAKLETTMQFSERLSARLEEGEAARLSGSTFSRSSTADSFGRYSVGS